MSWIVRSKPIPQSSPDISLFLLSIDPPLSCNSSQISRPPFLYCSYDVAYSLFFLARGAAATGDDAAQQTACGWLTDKARAPGARVGAAQLWHGTKY